MPRTPDRRPGALEETEIHWTLTDHQPHIPGHMSYVDQGNGNGIFLFKDKDGVYDPRYGDKLDESKYKIRITKWSESSITIPSNDWTTVYELTTQNSIFRGAIFQLNTNKVLFKFITDNTTAIDIDLEEYINNFKLLNNNSTNKDGNFNVQWPLFCYAGKLWNFNSGIIRIETNIKIQLKAKSGSKKVYRGHSWWGLKNDV